MRKNLLALSVLAMTAVSGAAAEAGATSDTSGTGVVANHNPLIDAKEFTFSFRKTKDEETGVETKRESVTAKLEIPSYEGIAAIINAGGAGLELLRQAVEDVISGYARQILNDDGTITTENFPADKISWDIIANLPESERRGRGIPKEVWEEFIKSYITHMPAILGRTVENVKKQASILAQKFQPLKAHEQKNELLPHFVNALGMYANNVPEAEQFSACLEFLVKKAEQFMNTDNNADLAANLGF